MSEVLENYSSAMSFKKGIKERMHTPKRGSLNLKGHFQFIRRMAIEKSFESMQKNLSIFLSGIVCYKPESEKVETPHNMFSWSEEDFYNRRRIKNTAWIEVFRMQLSKTCMETRKLQIDIKEIMKYTSLIYDKFHGKETYIMLFLQTAYDFLKIFRELENSFGENYSEEGKLRRNYHQRTFNRDEENERNRNINKIEYVLFESEVYDPIEVRYQVRYYNMAVEEFQEKKLAEQDAVRKQTENIKKQIRVEIYCSQCTLNALYAEIGKYKNRIEYMDALYAKELDEIDNKLNYKRFNMDKMRTQKSYLEEQIIRFNEEIAHIQMMEFKEAERLKLEWEKQQMEQNEKSQAKGKTKQKKKKK